MSISTKGKQVVFEVKAKQPPPTNPTWKAEYVFELLRDAMKFEMGMREQGFITELNRKFIWWNIHSSN